MISSRTKEASLPGLIRRFRRAVAGCRAPGAGALRAVRDLPVCLNRAMMSLRLYCFLSKDYPMSDTFAQLVVDCEFLLFWKYCQTDEFRSQTSAWSVLTPSLDDSDEKSSFLFSSMCDNISSRIARLALFAGMWSVNIWSG